MNGGFRVRSDGKFVANSLNVSTAQKGIYGAAETTTNKVTQTNQSGSASPLPSILLPKGGGAIRGIGEKFAANPVTGTGSLTVPIFTTPGRSGFGPQLSLAYDSGSGNGPFGFGWSLLLPSISRKTDKGLPRYQDANESDVFILSGAEDMVPVFKKDQDGNWIPDAKGNLIIDEEERDGYMVRRYRPRIEGLFARIERWTSIDKGDVHWRSISKDNILTVYGRDEQSRIADPADMNRVFSWLICESYDDKGNAIVYEYADENDNEVDLSQVNEHNRLRTANRYLKCIKYGNRKPLLLDATVPGFRISHIVQPDITTANWMFEVVFDYDEGHYEELPLDTTPSEAEQHRFVQASASAGTAWSSRPDPFSIYRAGFEIRTYRRCKRVMMFHNFPELGNEPCLVRSTEFDYNDMDYSQPVAVETELEHKGSTRFASFIRKVTQSGYVRDETRPSSILNDVTYLTYLKKSLPPLEFDYSQAAIKEEIKEIDPVSLENLPEGVDGVRYQWVDIDGEGLSGILTEQAGAWFYKPNLGDGEFGPMENVATKPSLASLSSGSTQLLDLAGDGQLDVVMLDSPVPGFYERTYDHNWENFTAFTSLPNVFWKDTNLKFVDLTGDGHADVMITEDEVFTWYPSLAEEGFGQSEMVRQALDEENGPRLVFGDGTQSIYLADFSGYGLTDLVRIRNGEVCYWPNLGYGRFGAKVTMDNAPWFDHPDMFDQKRIRLADVDGSGVTDIIYLGIDGAQIFFNYSGNSWSGARKLTSFPHIDNITSVQVADLFGNGTACLVWSSPLPGDSNRPMLYIDLMGGQKPHLLKNSKNNMGAETVVEYAASTKFYLKDKAEGKPWITRIPFPVHVVERVETYDYISKNRFVTRYAYHHGYFDGIEREFRGFGMVEQRDTEEFAVLSASDAFPSATNIDKASHVPPVLTKTWFHTGAYFEGGIISKQFEKEYYREGDPSLGEGELSDDQLQAMLLPDTVLPDDLIVEEAREACRSLKGSILRQEVYALDRRPDGTPTEESDRPYTVSERNYTMKRLQPRGQNKHAVFFVHPCETIDFHYERKLYDIPDPSRQTQKRADSRVTHSITLAVDDFGNVLQSAAISYGRRYDDPDKSLSDDDRKKQKPKLNDRALALATYTESIYTNSIDDPAIMPDAYRAPLPYEMRTYELLKMTPDANESLVTNIFRFNEIMDKINGSRDGTIKGVCDGNHDINYEDIEATGANSDDPHRRLIECVRTLYRPNDLGVSGNDRFMLLSPRTVESLGLPGETYKLAFTPGLIDTVYQRKHRDQEPEKLLPDDPSDILGSKAPDGGGYVNIDNDGHWWIPSGRVFYWPDITNDPAQELNFARNHFFLPHRFCDPFGNNTVITYDSSETDPRRNHNLLLTGTRDPLYNTVVAQNNYRVLQPVHITDPNEAISEVRFDALGLVVVTAIHKGNEGDSFPDDQPDIIWNLTQEQVNDFFTDPRCQAMVRLGTATTCIIYDVDRYYLTKDPDKPPYAATIVRETHVSDPVPEDGLKVQVSFSYSDGFGRDIQKKIPAEPGPVEDGGPLVDPRWVGSGWTIFNNKGKPVRQYEPFFSDTHQFEFAKIKGVSTILFYDPVERVICTLHPNNTYEKVVFDPWQQKTYDVNDTVTFDSRTDPDISGYVAEYFKQDAQRPEDWETWIQQRGVDPDDPPQDAPGLDPEKKAAVRTLPLADTPNVAYFDSLGRTFLTIAHNKFERGGAIMEEKYATRINLDIEGNHREVIDAKDRIVMRYDYDMLSSRIHQESMEAGERWMLNDVTGKPIRTWDSRGFQRRMTYDALQRPVELFVTDTTGTESLAEKTEYGESKPDPEITNHRLKPWKVYDGAGVVVSDSYDFKGNLLISTRQLLSDYRSQVDWEHDPPLETETFTIRTTYDALNRPIQMVAPHSSRVGTKLNVTQPVYNEANLLEREDVWLEQDVEPDGLLDTDTVTQHAVRNIDYNAKGQREFIEYGNGVRTQYEYDPKTFRMIHLFTTRGTSFPTDCSNPDPCADPPYDCPKQRSFTCGLQNIHYTYDPVGNIATIRDDAQQTIYFNGQVVRPDAEYKYDAIYRLIEAKGREHIGQASIPHTTWNDRGRVNLAHPNDGQAMRKYCESYEYDEVGNILFFIHHANEGDWIRTYTYDEKSLIEEQDTKNNRLTKTIIRGATEGYTYDEHGNMTRMPHLPEMVWDFKDQLQKVDKGGGCVAYYVYNASGERVRKVIEQDGNKQKERIYIGGFEVYRNYTGSDTLERETLHIMDDKQRVAMVETRTQGSDLSPRQLIRYQHGNHLGSASLELDDQAHIISYEEYYPYGSTSYQGVRKDIEVPLKRYRYTGKERDEETGLYYHGARYYAPWLGRWVSCDPEGLADGENLYTYVRDNPITWMDRLGLKTIDPELAQQHGFEINPETGRLLIRINLSEPTTEAQVASENSESQQLISPESRVALDIIEDLYPEGVNEYGSSNEFGTASQDSLSAVPGIKYKDKACFPDERFILEPILGVPTLRPGVYEEPSIVEDKGGSWIECRSYEECPSKKERLLRRELKTWTAITQNIFAALFSLGSHYVDAPLLDQREFGYRTSITIPK
jgi:RHS repeat-associated protein